MNEKEFTKMENWQRDRFLLEFCYSMRPRAFLLDRQRVAVWIGRDGLLHRVHLVTYAGPSNYRLRISDLDDGPWIKRICLDYHQNIAVNALAEKIHCKVCSRGVELSLLGDELDAYAKWLPRLVEAREQNLDEFPTPPTDLEGGDLPSVNENYIWTKAAQDSFDDYYINLVAAQP